jgi:crotonobetainyl-CoA:carnitine CoA-transferase CaiB-like acyl-CoA transferase
MLEGIRVLDLCDESGSLAGKILGDLGADVVKVEPPGGDLGGRRPPHLGGIADPERSLAWLALNTSKRGIALDLASPADRDVFRRLAASADVVLECFAPGRLAALGLGYEVLARANPRLVQCAITPFGSSGPRAAFRASDLGAVAMGGNLLVTGEPGRPPMRCSMPTAYYHAGPEAALGVLFALCDRERTGRGQHVDVSLQETQLQTLLSGASQLALHGRLPLRSGARMGRTREIWPAKDGMVSYGLRGGAARVQSLTALVDWMHECGMAPEWLRSYDFSSYSHLEVSDADLARLETVFGAFFASKTMGELYAGALARRVLLAPCNDAREIVHHAQLRARELFARLDYPELDASLEHPDFFARTPDRAIRIRRRAPRVGEHQREVLAEWAPREPDRVSAAEPDAGAGPRDVFAGLRVLEVGSGAAGPVATRYLAEHGARVIRLESLARPDFLRVLFLTRENRHGVDGSPMFVLLNPNKESVTLNLKHPEARELALRLVAWADVLCENYAPGVMQRFGLDWESARRVNPRLVMASGCLFGQTGPQRSYPGFGGQGSAISGFNHLTGRPDGPAHGPYGTITDSLSPRYVAIAIAAALWRRARTGQGQYIDLSQIESAVYSLSELVVRYSAHGEVSGRRGNRHELVAPHGVFPCAGEDRWIAIAVWSDAEWRSLARAMGDPPWARDARFDANAGRLAHADEVERRLAEWTRGFEPHALMERLQARGLEACAVQSFADLLEDPQLAWRGHWVPLRHVHLGELPFERSGFRLSGGSGRLRSPGPNLGEHDDAVLGELLGLSREERARLAAEGVTV